ncbi:MAG: Uma2 family endonuclease, partial [Ignavibacteriae bacterium]|nr:Uma2 family endonuclease [Ignavibacteriota bacterium]
LYTYPDVIVVCGDPRYLDDKRDTLLNPCLIIEVLSDSTENYDRGRKFEHYRSLDSLKEYVLVAQDKPHVEVFVRQGDRRWVLSEFSREDDVIALDSVACSLPLKEIYHKVELP